MINDQNETGNNTTQPSGSTATPAPVKKPFFDPTKKAQYVAIGIAILIAAGFIIHSL